MSKSIQTDYNGTDKKPITPTRHVQSTFKNTPEKTHNQEPWGYYERIQ